MPRLSAADRAATFQRAGFQKPQPPAGLSDKASALWREIVSCRPADFFAPGNLSLLHQYCQLSVILREVTDRLESDIAEGVDPAECESQMRAVTKMTHTTMVLATKLRLTVQNTTHPRSGILSEVSAFDSDDENFTFGREPIAN